VVTPLHSHKQALGSGDKAVTIPQVFGHSEKLRLPDPDHLLRDLPPQQRVSDRDCLRSDLELAVIVRFGKGLGLRRFA